MKPAAPSSPAYQRFMSSMIIGFDEWHDGIGYDLEALAELEGDERKAVEALLVSRKDEGWRDAEALAALGSPKARTALKTAARGPNREVRLHAARNLEGEDLDRHIAEALTNGGFGDGLAQAELLAEQEPLGPATRAALLQGALTATDGRQVRFVGLLLFHHGLAPEPFDWSQRPYFLEFLTEDTAERRRLFDGLCEKLGVDGPKGECR